MTATFGRSLLLLGVVFASCATRETASVEHRAEGLIRDARQRTGDVTLHCDPPDADVYVDGVPQGACADYAGAPNGLVLGRGMHQIDVKKDGYAPWRTYYEARGARAVLRITLLPTTSGQEGER